MYISCSLINPIIFSIGPFSAHWYGLMYIISFLFAIWYCKKKNIPNKEIEKLFYTIFLGSCVGGRIGYIIFYNFSYFSRDFFYLFKIWQGGMSFHGGLIGSIIAIFLYSKIYKKNFLETSDMIVPSVPFGLGAGRLGNFINGELWGRFSPNMPYSCLFPCARSSDLQIINKNPQFYDLFKKYGSLPRHPSQIYEFFLEGILLFFIIYLFNKTKKPTGIISGIFLIFYGIFRIITEFFREPNIQIEFLKQKITMGQILSIPMIIIGLIIIINVYYKKNLESK